MKRLLLAVGDPNYSSILKQHFSQHPDEFSIINQEVLHVKYLAEIIRDEKPDMLLIHDTYLDNDITDSIIIGHQWLKIFSQLRTEYEDSIRIAFLCERSEDDNFLGALASINVMDIFNGQAIKIGQMIEQLKQPPRFANVAKYRTELNQLVVDIPRPVDDKQVDEPTTSKNVKKERPKKERPQKVIEKKVVNKVVEKRVVNKQVIKRQIGITLQHNVEKVVGVPVEKKLILFASPLQRSGTTFISHLLMDRLQQIGLETTFIESPYGSSYTYDRFNGFAKNPNYRSVFYTPKDTDIELTDSWQETGVNFIVKHPKEPHYTDKDVPFDVFSKILLGSTSTITIIDVGSHWKEETVKDLFDIAHHIYFVLEPDISNIQYLEESEEESVQLYQNLLAKQKTSLILNRCDPQLLKNEVIRTLSEDTALTAFPSLPSVTVFEAQYTGERLLQNKGIAEAIVPILNKMLPDFLPADFIKKQTKGERWFTGLLKRSISIKQNTIQKEEN